jgi:hypothetical protein
MVSNAARTTQRYTADFFMETTPSSFILSSNIPVYLFSIQEDIVFGRDVKRTSAAAQGQRIKIIPRPLIDELCRIEGGIMNAERALQRLSREKARMDYRSEIHGAKEHGREEGIAIGEQRGEVRVLDIARRLKAQGLSPEQITGATGLSPHDIAAL